MKSWRNDAACLDSDPELFFSSDKEDQSKALAVCHSCPVRRECLSFADMAECLPVSVTYGIWGGMTAGARLKTRWERVAA